MADEDKQGEQVPLFDKGEWWDEHWKGMPEFVQKDLTPIKSIYVHFDKAEHIEEFSRLVGQKITMNTQCIWYPEAEIGRIADKRYVDAAESLDDDGDTEVLDSE